MGLYDVCLRARASALCAYPAVFDLLRRIGPREEVQNLNTKKESFAKAGYRFIARRLVVEYVEF